ncbi:hypothetical protein H5410_022148 [Solanum commersonii]|uniref:Uncharacterized protein n=1 Tax=Solanum commersonii TaxID=4109 RepID=A0A9J5ZD37_SOLCO|nr:hypothetical protein H5410_022148 [Solanum commersonii]
MVETRTALADAACCWPTSVGRCVQATFDVCRRWMMSLAIGRRCLPDAHMPRLSSRALIDLCRWRRLPSRGVDACMPWLMPPAVSRHCLPDADMPRLMRASLG